MGREYDGHCAKRREITEEGKEEMISPSHGSGEHRARGRKFPAGQNRQKSKKKKKKGCWVTENSLVTVGLDEEEPNDYKVWFGLIKSPSESLAMVQKPKGSKGQNGQRSGQRSAERAEAPRPGEQTGLASQHPRRRMVPGMLPV